MLSRNWLRLLGVRVDSVNWEGLGQYFQDSLAGQVSQQIVTVNGEQILAASRDPSHRDVINQAELVVPDSTNVLWLSRLKGRGLTQKIPGVDLVWQLAKIATEKKASIFLLGGRDEVPAKAAQKLQKTLPGLKIAGISSEDPDNQDGIKHLRESKADIALVAYGAPKQEYWIAKHKAVSGAKILVGVGGTFDILAGVLPRAPKIFQSLQLEWLWRLILQPTRLGRIWNAVVVFPLKALFWKDPA